MKTTCLDRERQASKVYGSLHSSDEERAQAKDFLNNQKLCPSCRNTFVQQYGYDDLLCSDVKEVNDE